MTPTPLTRLSTSGTSRQHSLARRPSKYQLFHTVHMIKASEDKSFSCIKQEDDANDKVGVTLSKEKRPYDNCRGCFENQHHHIKPSCAFNI
ncbi:hypothetical protein S83_030897 [Arachis hypogaea]